MKSPRSEIASAEPQAESVCEVPRTLRNLVFLEQILYLILSFFTSSMVFFFSFRGTYFPKNIVLGLQK